MEIIKIDKKIEEKVKKEKLNVAAYARVSTDHDDQLGSFESQKLYYENIIMKHNDWNFAGVYADEGISGTHTLKRENFLRMVNDALIGKIDIILTKSISRFARNTVDTLKYVRLLKERNIAIIFEEERINTLDNTGEFLITVLSSVAQQESENISYHVRKGHEMLLKGGNILLGSGCLGYRFINKDKKIEIVPEEAKVVRLIFKLFLEGNSLAYIKRELESRKILTYKKRKNWDITNIKNILTNEKYTGDLLQGKRVKLNPFVRPVKNKGESNKYLIRDFHEPIISKEDFIKTQYIIKEKYDNIYGHDKKKTSCLSHKTKCGFCGSALHVVRRKKTGFFSECGNRKENGRVACPNSRDIHSEKVFNIIIKGINNCKDIINNSKDKDLLYVKRIISSTTNLEINEEILGKMIKLVFVGGYDCYKRTQPYMVRIVLFNNYPLSDYQIKKITIEETINIKAKKIYEGWVSQKIICYGPPGPTYKRTEISKVKVVVEVETANSENCTLV